jgi:hypothetical protein
MRIPSRILLLAVVAITLLISGASIAGSRRVSPIAPRDCAENCRNNRDRMLERCNTMPEAARDNCQERTNKQYEKCVERCNNSGNDVRPNN